MENNLKNLSRMELLQVLLQVTESNEALMAENAELKSVSSMQVSRSAKVGSIAEAALKVNGFFEAAQRSADDYLREVKKLRDEMIERSKAQAAAQVSQSVSAVSPDDELEQSQLFERIQDQAKTYIQDVQTYANNVMARANSQAQGILDDARMRSDEIIAQANDQARVIIEEAEERAALKEGSLAEAALLVEQPEVASFEEEQIESATYVEEASESAQPASELPAVEQLEAETLEVEEPEPTAFEAESIEAEQPVADASEARISGTEQLEDAMLSEVAIGEEPLLSAAMGATDIPEGLVEEPILEDDVTDKGTIDENALNEAEFSVLDAEMEGAQTEGSPAEGSHEEVSQSTAPLNIDVIVSDIAATAFSEAELDPGSTGALVRRGRHVKLPEGMTM